MKAKGKNENSTMQNIHISILGVEESDNLYYHLSNRNWAMEAVTEVHYWALQ